MATLQQRIGDTFHAEGVYANDNGTAVNLMTAGVTPVGVIEQIGGTFKHEIGAQLANQGVSPGRYFMTTDTAEWPEGDLLFLVEYRGGEGGLLVASSTPVHVEAVVEITNGAPGDDDMDISPVLATVTTVPSRTATMTAAGRAEIAEPMDPGARRRFFIALAAVAVPTIGEIEWIGFRDQFDRYGLQVRGGDYRPILDTTNVVVAPEVEVDRAFQNHPIFNGDGLLAELVVRVKIADSLDEAVEYSALIRVKNL